MHLARFFSLLIVLSFWGGVQAADSIREQRQAKEIEAALRSGKALWLDAAGTPFLALEIEGDGKVLKGGAILLHDQNGFPDGPGLIGVLRQGLARNGWETLALQLPMAAADAPQGEWQALVPEAGARLEAAIQRFTQRKIKHLVIIGEGLGARMALEYLAKNKKTMVKGLILLGLSVDGPEDASLAALKKIKVPVLDLCAQQSQAADPEGQRKRRQMARYAGNADYQQNSIQGAVTGFPGHEQLVLMRLKGWLGRKLPNSYPDHYKKLGKQM